MKLKIYCSLTWCLVLLIFPFPARAYYDPGLQRWINRDPIQEKGGANLYRFAQNEPVASVDPNGRCALLLPFVAGALGISTEALVTGIGSGIAAGLGWAVGTALTTHPTDAIPPGGVRYPGGQSTVNAPTLNIPYPAAPPIRITLNNEKDHSEELEDAEDEGYRIKPRDRRPDKMKGEDSDPARGRKLSPEEAEKLQREIEKYKKGEGRGGGDNIDPACLE